MILKESIKTSPKENRTPEKCGFLRGCTYLGTNGLKNTITRLPLFDYFHEIYRLGCLFVPISFRTFLFVRDYPAHNGGYQGCNQKGESKQGNRFWYICCVCLIACRHERRIHTGDSCGSTQTGTNPAGSL